MQNTIDHLFNADQLTWLPWIGKNYMSHTPENKVLIVGESHYHEGTEETINKHKQRGYTRLCIQENAIDGYHYNTKVFPNLHMALLNDAPFEPGRLWDNLCFYNFIQRPLNMKTGERPSTGDFHTGWKAFFHAVEILKPSTCLFIGNSSSGKLMKNVKATKWKCPGIQQDGWINKSYGRHTTLTDTTSEEMKFVFVRHTSGTRGGFDTVKWHEYLQKHIPQQIDWIKSVAAI